MKFRLLKRWLQFLIMSFSLIFGLLYRCRIVTSEVSLAVSILIFYCELLHYNVVIQQCSWPGLSLDKEDFSIPTTNENLLKIMVLSDLHLKCTENGNGLILDDEVHMGRCFRTALRYLEPDVVFILGGLLDKEIQCTSKELDETLLRFQRDFSVPRGTQIFFVPGSSEVEYIHQMHRAEKALFMNAFNTSSVKFLTIKKNHFVLLNSMIYENDSCSSCSLVDEQLSGIEKMLNCSIEYNRGNCDSHWTLPVYSKPLLIQNFPLFRKSNDDCSDYDSTPGFFKYHRAMKKRSCLSENASVKILRKVNPRVVFSGHMDHGCKRFLPGGEGVEIIIPSFNWKAAKKTAMSLATVTTNNHEIIECQMPRFSTIITIYVVGSLIIVTWIYYSYKTKRFLIMK